MGDTRRCECGHSLGQHEIRSGGLMGCYISGCLCIDFAEPGQGAVSSGLVLDFSALDRLIDTDPIALGRAAVALANEVLRLRKQIEHRQYATVYERAAWHHDIGRHTGSLPFSFCPRCELEHPQGIVAKLGDAAARLAELLDDAAPSGRGVPEAIMAWRAAAGAK